MNRLFIWCNDEGDEYSDDKELNRAKRSGNAYIKISDSCESSETMGLPTPHQLTGDSEWNEGGRLLKQYDLKVVSRQGDKMSSGVNMVSSTTINTSSENKTINNIPIFDNKNDGVKVLIPNQKKVDNPSDGIEDSISNDDNENSCDNVISLNLEGDVDEEDTNNPTDNDGNATTVEEDEHCKLLTPYICKKGCIHYDGVTDVNNGIFKEFCMKRFNGKEIWSGYRCDEYDDGKIEGILSF